MISISTTTYRTNRLIIIRDYKVNSIIHDVVTRMSKTKTLDAGVVVVHNGVVQGDRNLDINGRLSEANVVVLREIQDSQTFVSVAIDDGVFNAVIQRLRTDGGNIQMRIEFQEKLTS